VAVAAEKLRIVFMGKLLVGMSPYCFLEKEKAMRGLLALVGTAMLFAFQMQVTAADTAPADAKSLFNGKDLTGWKLRIRDKPRPSKWQVVAAVSLKAGEPGRFDAKDGQGILLCGDDGRGVDLISELEHGDCELWVEFTVPKGSNSGIYFQGQYEVQILDSFGKKDEELKYGDCGGIYNTAAPRKNASKAPGEWQTFHIVFRAPRFDSTGKKTENARFLKVVHNGVTIHENVEVAKPTTASLGGAEKPTGPLMIQGDHGPVAFRSIRMRLGH